MNCIFCKIINKELPANIIYEDKNVLAFLDIAPVSHGHTLVIPKKHFENLEEISEEELTMVIKSVKKIGLAIKKSLNIKAYNLILNNGSLAGQMVPHLHFHIIPRQENDGHKLWQQGKYNDGEAEDILQKIKQAV